MALEGPNRNRFASREPIRTQFAFGAEGKFVAYGAFRSGSWVAMVGDTELGKFRVLDQPVMDEAARHYAFRAAHREGHDEGWWIIKNGTLDAGFGWLGEIVINRGGDLAFWERPSEPEFIEYVDMVFHTGRKKSEPYHAPVALMPPRLSLDGRTVLTLHRRERSYIPLLFKRGTPTALPSESEIQDIALSPNGKRVALTIVEGGPVIPPGIRVPAGVEAGKYRVRVGESTYGEGVDAAFLADFSPNSKTFVFRYLKGDRLNLAFDGEELPAPEFEFVGNPVFHPKRDEVAFATCSGGPIGPVTRLHREGERLIRGGRWSLHRRRKGEPANTLIENVEDIEHVTFGPQGAIACAVLHNGGWRIVAGNHKSPPYDDVGRPWWDRKGETIWFGCRVDRELRWAKLDLR